MRADLVVKSDRIVFPDEIAPGALAVKDGRIVSISEKRWAPQTFEVLDATGRVVFPGVIDPHVHAREPGTEDREDFATCSRGAAAGGVTTFLEQPVSVPPTWNVANLRAKKARASAKSVVDFGLYGGVGITSLDQLAGMVEEGVCAFKTFLHEPYPGREKEFEGIYATDDGDLLEVFA
ncbi:MAG: amidohydrolase family protein, partial [Planifilum fulgidum]